MRRLFVLQHIEREGPQLFATLAFEYGIEIIIIRLYKYEKIPLITNTDAILVLGGPMGLRDIFNPNYSWLLQEVKLLKKAILEGIPTIGVCLGAQLLSYAAGGDVEEMVEGDPPVFKPEVGWARIYPKANKKIDLLMPYFDQPIYVLHWHGDRILLPEKANLLAFSKRCEEQFFSIGSLAYGLQFHLEIELKNYYEWIKSDIDFVRQSLGVDGEQILLKQSEIYLLASEPSRIRIIRGIFETLLSKT